MSPKLQIARTALKRVGKKTREWERVRRILKVQFEKWGITCCELCGSDFALSFSHRVKRRFIEDEKELRTVILVCARHHEYLENHPRKVEIHDQIIEARI